MNSKEAAATQSRNRGRVGVVRIQKLEDGLQGRSWDRGFQEGCCVADVSEWAQCMMRLLLEVCKKS